MQDIDRPIEDHHEQMLKSLLLIRDDKEKIPTEIVEAYWKFARLARRIGHPITPDILILIVSQHKSMPKEQPVSFLDDVEKHQLTRNTKVIAKFRNKWRWGLFQKVRLDDKKIIVMLDDDNAEERAFAPTSVRMPTSEELSEIGAA